MQDYHMISFSGGKDSTAMLLMMKKKKIVAKLNKDGGEYVR